MNSFKLAVLPALLICSMWLRGQDSITVVYYTNTKSWVKMIEGVDYFTPQQKERARYMWGNRSYPSTKSALWFNDSTSFYSDLEEEGRVSNRPEAYYIKRNFSSAQRSEIVPWLGKVYIINDTLILPKWKILNDIREIAGHICMSANFIDSVKMQNVVAWFALDIPHPAGPENYCGLPGLILGIEVNNGALVIMAESIKTLPLVGQMEMPAKHNGRKIKGKSITNEQYRALQEKYFAEKKKSGDNPFWGIRY